MILCLFVVLLVCLMANAANMPFRSITSANGAVCLDGSNAGYYYRMTPGFSLFAMIFFDYDSPQTVRSAKIHNLREWRWLVL